MIVPVLVLVAVLTVPLTGGKLSELAAVRVRWFPLLFSALVIQVLIIEVVAHWPEALLTAAHLASYGMAGAFAVVNLRIPGLWIVALGGIANFLPIVANGGVMPATAAAQELAGRGQLEGFANSGVLENPRLWFLGDVFAIPASWPFANVFSVGDVLIVVGVAVGLHRICHTRLAPAREPLFTVEV